LWWCLIRFTGTTKFWGFKKNCTRLKVIVLWSTCFQAISIRRVLRSKCSGSAQQWPSSW
jgi:hypothetical protein